MVVLLTILAAVLSLFVSMCVNISLTSSVTDYIVASFTVCYLQLHGKGHNVLENNSAMETNLRARRVIDVIIYAVIYVLAMLLLYYTAAWRGVAIGWFISFYLALLTESTTCPVVVAKLIDYGDDEVIFLDYEGVKYSYKLVSHRDNGEKPEAGYMYLVVGLASGGWGCGRID